LMTCNSYRWRVTHTDDVTNRINSTVKYIRKYNDDKIPSVYTEKITLRFQKGKSYDDIAFVLTKWLTELFYQ
jgi:hypothetical protein